MRFQVNGNDVTLHGLSAPKDKVVEDSQLSLQKWRPYLLGRQFIVRTDQRSLQYLWSQRISTEAQQRWLYKLMGFDFIIQYKKGKENVVADALSRRGENDGETGELVALSHPIPNWVEAIKEEVTSNLTLKELVQRVEEGEALGPWKLQDGVLFYKERIYLDEDFPLVMEIIAQFYNTAGIAQTYFEHIFKLHGMPRNIVCDRDPIFTSGFWSELFRLNGTEFNYSSAYHPQTDGQSEVVNRTMEMYLQCFTSS
ncbi:hypothetical protein F0562_001487 [Nyssa sinensis]|uniref:Integrase catalytic domain-containing protein n=1 Tax=Nyssa sinensis TaxID=561372 RepID=A0A5J5C336_9ASTE|nr:hypothetical protein F0562_001487 [Nyssa sinensis]